MPRTLEEIDAQEERMDAMAKDFIEDLLAGKASIEFLPLLETTKPERLNCLNETALSGSLLGGFTIRLRPAR